MSRKIRTNGDTKNMNRQDNRVAKLKGSGTPRKGISNRAQKCLKGLHKYDYTTQKCVFCGTKSTKKWKS